MYLKALLMNSIRGFLFTFLFAQFTHASELSMLINNGVDGSWLSEEPKLEGLFIETIPSTNTLLAFWFMFDQANNQSEWRIAMGDISGASSNMEVFSQASDSELNYLGTGQIEFASCSSARFDYSSSLDGTLLSLPIRRATPDIDCASNQERSQLTFVTSSNSWLNVEGEWEFNGCVTLGPNKSHGREVFRFGGRMMSFDIDNYDTSTNCTGAKTTRNRPFELTRVDKVKAKLGADFVIANRVLAQPVGGGNTVKQILYFDDRVTPPRMAHGNFDEALDSDGYPATLHELFFTPLP